MRGVSLFLGFFFFFLFSYCTIRNEDGALNQQSIVGTWHWKESRGGITGNEIISPENTGVTIKLVFGTNKKVTVFTDNIETGTYDYTIQLGKSIFDSEPQPILSFNAMNYVIEKINDTEMRIHDNFVDGYVLNYTK